MAAIGHIVAEADWIPISSLQHLAFCERQCALIHVEKVWAENRLTAEGRLLHERVHEVESETRPGIRIARGLRLKSNILGITGIADIVEFRSDPAGARVPGLRGRWVPIPVEYKRGRPKPDRCDEVQVCAQAMCLEEMLETRIDEGSIFYGRPHRRHSVNFEMALRREVKSLALRVHEIMRSGQIPPAVFGAKCKNCSLLDICKPNTIGAKKSARRYLGQMLTS